MNTEIRKYYDVYIYGSGDQPTEQSYKLNQTVVEGIDAKEYSTEHIEPMKDGFAPDKQGIYISPSGDRLRIFRDNEWIGYTKDSAASPVSDAVQTIDELVKSESILFAQYCSNKNIYPNDYSFKQFKQPK